jgi:hypothetical protein
VFCNVFLRFVGDDTDGGFAGGGPLGGGILGSGVAIIYIL